ncbi:MAG: tRNA-uridine aminocarboxypropyltransferase [Thalassotalea sp.]
MNDVQRLYHHRKSLSTKPFAARGWKVVRCQQCLVAQENCICQFEQTSSSSVGFVLLMNDGEVLKPSNTGKLIANVIPNTYAFIWQRTEVDKDFLALLNNPKWQPMVIFPKEYAEPEQTIFEDDIPLTEGKKPLFIMLDGSWREARRMYRKSSYLHHLPMVSFASDFDFGDEMKSRYQLREAAKTGHLATAEVAARVLTLVGEHQTANHLDLWLDLFIHQYQKSVGQKSISNINALACYQEFIAVTYD